MLKAAIFGSRTLSDDEAYNFIKEEIRRYSKRNEIEYLIVPGGIDGACKMACRVAEELTLPLFLYFYKKGDIGFLKSIITRTKEIITKADFFLVFHDGSSKGTLWDIKQIKKAGKEYAYFLVPQEEDFGLPELKIIEIEEKLKLDFREI